MPEIRENDTQIYRKSFENRPLGPPWGLCGATLEALGKHFGHMLPKDWILEALGRVLGAQSGQLGSNLGAQEAPKSRPKPQMIDVEKQHIFGIDFGRARTSFWDGFW